MTISYQPKSGFGAVLNVAAGEDMKILNTVAGSNSNSFDVVQGFVQYAGAGYGHRRQVRIIVWG